MSVVDSRAALPAPKLADWLSGRREAPRPYSAPAFRRWQTEGKDLPEIAEFHGKRQVRPRTAVPGTPKKSVLKPRTLVGDRRRSTSVLSKIAREDETAMSKAIQFGLHVRDQNEVDVVVACLRDAVGKDKKENFRAFTPPYNAHRQAFEKKISDVALERKVLNAMKREGGSFGSLTDLLQCTPSEWVRMGTLLDGCTLGTVKRCAMEYMERGLTPLDRAATITSLSWRNPFRERGRVCHFPKDGEKVPESALDKYMGMTNPLAEIFMVGAV